MFGVEPDDDVIGLLLLHVSVLSRHHDVDGLAAALDDAGVLRVESNTEAPDSAHSRNAAIAEVQAQEVSELLRRQS